MKFNLVTLSKVARLSPLFAGATALMSGAEPPALPIDTVIAEIVAQNPELKFYAAEIEAAQAGRRTAGARSDPELSVELGRKRVRDVTGVAAGEGIAWSVSITQTFEWPGRQALRKAIANSQVQLAELGLARFQHALQARARTLAHGLHAANAKAAAVREVADRFAALKEVYLAREPAGITPLLETRVIEASELTLQRRATEAELELQAALLELNQLRGAKATAPLRVHAPEMRFGEAPTSDVLLAAALENNFDFKVRRAELAQQGFEVRLARNERYPSISVSPYYSREQAGERESTAGVGVSLPLPLSGRTGGGIEVAEARRRQAEAALLVAQRELEREVLLAAQAFTIKSAEARRWPADSVRKFRESAELADRHFRLGAVPIATYVELQNSYLDAVDALLATRHEALEAGLTLQQLTGVDFRAVEVVP